MSFFSHYALSSLAWRHQCLWPLQLVRGRGDDKVRDGQELWRDLRGRRQPHQRQQPEAGGQAGGNQEVRHRTILLRLNFFTNFSGNLRLSCSDLGLMTPRWTGPSWKSSASSTTPISRRESRRHWHHIFKQWCFFNLLGNKSF